MSIAIDLSTREARLQLPVRVKPYFVKLIRGLYLGYRRNQGPGTWSVRFVEGSEWDSLKLVGAADDADGIPGALSYQDACNIAREKAGAPAATVMYGRFNPQALSAELIEQWAQRTRQRIAARARK
jgi:hypothetical protein